MTTTPRPGPQESVEVDPDATPPHGIAVPGQAEWRRPRHAGPPAGRTFVHAPAADPGWWPSAPPERLLPAEPLPAEPLPAARSATVPPWLFGIAVLALLTVVGVLGFITPGFFVTTVLNQVAVQNGVRTVLQHDYQLPNVAEVVCPAKQKALPGREFTCVARINNAPAQVRVVVQDRDGSYQVRRPA